MRLAKVILKKNRVVALTLLHFQTSYRATVINTTWYWQKNRWRDQWNRTESLVSTFPVHWFSSWAPGQVSGGNVSLFKKWYCCYCCWVASVVSDSVRLHRRQPTRLRHPWDTLGKNTGVGCHFLLQCMKVKSKSEVAQLYLTYSDPMDCSLPGSSVHGFSRQEYWSGVPSPSPRNDTRTTDYQYAIYIYIKLDHYLIPYTKSNSKWVIDLSICRFL